MSRSILGWDGAGGGYFDPPERDVDIDVDDPPQGPPLRRLETVPWCDRCGRPVAPHDTCVACGVDEQDSGGIRSG